MKKLLVAFLLIFSVSATLPACGGRTPSPKTAHGKIEKHFKKYGKKYKDSDFGQHKVDRVEISSIREIQKNMAEVESFVYLTDGIVYKVRVLCKKRALRWRVISWETLGRA